MFTFNHYAACLNGKCAFLLADQILLMLKKWSEDEGPGATNEEIIYILECLKMAIAVKDVFQEKSPEN